MLEDNPSLNEEDLISILDIYKYRFQNYKDALSLLKGDIELASNGIETIVAIDFYDLYEHCLPTLNFYRGNSINEEEISKYLDRELGRCALFYFLNFIYSKPALLLPPYMIEVQQFLAIFSSELHWLSKKNETFYKNFSDYLADKIKNINNKKSNYDYIRDLMQDLNKLAPDLAYFISPGYNAGKNGLIRLVNREVRPDTNRIENYSKFLNEIHKMDYEYIKEVLYYLRPGRWINNKRDAKAIQYVEKLNDPEKIGDNKILILVSSANHFKRFRDKIECNKENSIDGNTFKPIYCERNIGHNRYPLIRDTKPFLMALVAICDLIKEKNINIDNFDFRDTNKEDLLSIIDKDLSLINNTIDRINCCDTEVGLDGKAKFDYLNNCIESSKEVDRIFEVRKRSELLLILRRHLPEYLKNEQMVDKLDQEIINSLIKLNEIIGSEDFVSYFREILNENEKDRISIDLKLRKIFKDLPKCRLRSRLENQEKYSVVLTKKDKSEVISLLVQDNFKVPSIPEICEINPNSWAILDNAENSTVLFIDKAEYDYYLTVLDLELFKETLSYLRKIMPDMKQELASICKNNELEIYKNRIEPIFEKIKYKDKYDIKKTYYDILNVIKS